MVLLAPRLVDRRAELGKEYAKYRGGGGFAGVDLVLTDLCRPELLELGCKCGGTGAALLRRDISPDVELTGLGRCSTLRIPTRVGEIAEDRDTSEFERKYGPSRSHPGIASLLTHHRAALPLKGIKTRVRAVLDGSAAGRLPAEFP